MQKLKFIFVSNYINHHQKPLCDALYERLGKDFAFVATMPMEAERVSMGWSTEMTELPYVRLLYKDDEAEQMIYDADCVLFGWSEREDIAQKRLLSGKPTLRVSERLYRDGRYKAISPRGLVAKYHEHIRFRKEPVYMLCAGAYTAADFSLIHAYPGKLLKWGYFPPFIEAAEQVRSKWASEYREMKDGIQLVWAGRFIPLKNADFALRLADRLKREGLKFHLHMVGAGELEHDLKAYIKSHGLEDQVTMYGFLRPEAVRKVMEKCHIHMCTSNQLEGWGAVVNEGMNSGCLELVSDRMGAVPFLIKDGVNGLTYSHDSYEEFEEKAVMAIKNWDKYRMLGKKAYETIESEWNASVAAKRLLNLIDGLISDPGAIELPVSGPMSRAEILKLR